MRFISWLAPLLFLVLSTSALCKPASNAAFDLSEKEWRARRLAQLTSENGWLTLVGLHWLHDGENPVGSGKTNSVRLPVGKAPEKLGAFILDKGRVRIRPESGIAAAVNGEPISARELKTDEQDNPDILQVGRLSLTVIKRGERFGIRVKDPDSPVRTGFKGLAYFNPREDYSVQAKFIPYDHPQERKIPTILNTFDTMTTPGVLRFKLHGREFSMEPFLEEAGAKEFFLIFKDKTSGGETYSAGRFLYTDLPNDGVVILDFNRAYNPPCAFTPYATCPLPPERNRLSVRIEAGEKKYAGGKH